MNFKCYIIALFSIIITSITLTNTELSAEEYYRILLKDKGPEKFEPGTDLYSKTLELHNQRCLERRAKNIQNLPLLTITDAPVYDRYIDLISNAGAKLYLKLRWNNYIIVKADSVRINSISKLSFVNSTQKVNRKYLIERNSIPKPVEIDQSKISKKVSLDTQQHTLNYGESLSQNSVMKAELLHGLGINGQGVLIGFLDSGFDWKRHISLKNSKVIAEYDFIDNNSITANEKTDVSNQDHHGTLVLSSVIGKSNGDLIGIAPEVEVLLAKTEDLKHECRIEEDAFAAGLEWMESQGVDIVNASLTYRNFDPEVDSYEFSDLIGWRTISADAVNKATERGVLCFISAGNKGPQPKTIGTPADADSALTIGALLKNSLETAEFSSRGPREDGKIKPDLATMGTAVYTANPSDSLGFFYINGTSLSSPLMAGGAALLLSIFPDATQYELKQMLINSAHNKSEPNNEVGFGQPDLYRAAFNSGAFISPPSYYRVGNYIRVQTTGIGNFENSSFVLFIRFYDKSVFQRYEMKADYENWIHYTDITIDLFKDMVAEAYIEIEDNFNLRYANDRNKYFDINPKSEKIQYGLKDEFVFKQTNNLASAWLNSNILESGEPLIVNLELPNGGDIKINIYDPLGRIIKKYEGYLNSPGYFTQTIETNGILSGTYYVFILTDSSKKMLPLIIFR